jgi:hypothetical protein
MFAYEVMAQSWPTTIGVAALFFAATGWLMATLTGLQVQSSAKFAYGTSAAVAVAVFSQLFFSFHASLANASLITAIWVASFCVTQLLVFARGTNSPAPKQTLVQGSPDVKVRPVESSVTVSGADLDAARERLAAKLDADFGKRAKRMTVGQGSTAKGSCLAVRMTVNAYEWKKQKLNGQSLEEFSAKIPRTFDGIPVQLTIRPE